MKTAAVSSELIYFLNQAVKIMRKANRKSMTVKMQADQPLLVLTNNYVATSQVITFLQSKKTWIEKNLLKMKEQHALYPQPEFKNGSYFPFLGELKYFQFADCSLKKIKFKIEDGFLICNASAVNRSDQQKLHLGLQQFYKDAAFAYLAGRVQVWSERTGLVPKKIAFRSPKTRWGSCSSQKHITLNWKLMCQAPQLVDYVIVHELCHLQYLNHSDHFWNLLETIMPTYQEFEKVLQQHVHLGNFLK